MGEWSPNTLLPKVQCLQKGDFFGYLGDWVLGYLLQLVHLCLEHEITFRQPVNLVCPQREFHLSPGEVDVGMMALFFGEFADLVGEGEGVAEIFEFVFAFEVMLIDDVPVGVKLFSEFLQLNPMQCRRSAVARNAFLFSQCAHNYESLLW